jgi:protease-4
MLPGNETWFSWTDQDNLTNWGLFLGSPNIGFGVVRDDIPLDDIPLGDGKTAGVYDYRFALSGGTKNATFGLGYGWSGGDDDLVGRSRLVQAGLTQRYGRYLSLGLVGNFATDKNYRTGIADLALRPFGDQMLTVFADAELPKGVSASDAPWSVGAMFDLGPGLQLTGRFFDDESYAFSVGYTMDFLGFSGSPQFDSNDKQTHNIWQARLGYPQRNILSEYFAREKTYVEMNLKGATGYRRFRFFDDDRHTLSGILADLEHAKNDPKVKGVALNLSGATMSRGTAWEIREKLADLQAAGKRVVVFVDNIEMTEYHLASVADKVVLDPEGFVMLPGYVIGRTYVKNALEKLGIGFEEWRFFKYKSAAETFSRDSMSDADREQRLDIIEDIYETVRSEITVSRKKDLATFDGWVNDTTMFNSHEAIEMGLVDTLGRWEDIKGVIAKLEGEKKRYVGRDMLAGNMYPSLLWGEDPKIAVVYGLGECSMDEGINARKLEKVFNALRDNSGVKGVVFRVDSPGGDGMASDVVAEALRKCAEKKPVIVSQGNVAGSGGYWISMYGTKIYALPTTITGSIGVIGGWMWDTGLGEKLGHTSDHVQVGEHADLGYGARLLLSGPMLPKRNLNDEERERMKTEILGFYDGFVGKVAKGRKMTEADVRKIAEGHVYSGTRGKEIGLVDEIGGLEAAIHAARDAAGIPKDEKITVVELPTMPAFSLNDLVNIPSPFGALFSWVGVGDDTASDESALHPEWTYIRALMKQPGRPLYMVPPEYQVYEASFGMVE